MTTFFDLVARRQSDRAFDPDRPVEKEKIQRILETVRLAPSACNSQPWHFIVVDDPETKNKLADAVASKILGINHFSKQAPVHAWLKDKNFAHIDVGIAAAHLVLAAEDEGLGSCIMGWFDEDKVRKLLGIPSGKRVLLDVVLGYSTQPDRKKVRKELDKIVSWNRYE